MPDDHALAADLATRAGELLLKIRSDLTSIGADLKVLKDTGDQESHDFLMAELAKLAPDDAILSEEGKDNTDRLSADRTWIVDPVDGTREYSEVPRTDWAVHVALVSAGQPIAGAVALPAQGLTLSTVEAPKLPPFDESALRFVASRTRPGPSADILTEHLGATMVPMGSAGAKAMAVVKGEAEIYAHTGGQYEWDSCAPVAVARSAGLHASRINGDELVYNNEDPYLPDLLICRPELADRILATLNEHL